MSKDNRLFPAWKRSKKGERMPGERPQKPKKLTLQPKEQPLTDVVQ